MAVVLRPLGPSRVVAGLGNIYGKAMDRARLSPRRSERFQAKWKPVRVKKTRQTKNLEPRFDSIKAEKALGWAARIYRHGEVKNGAAALIGGHPQSPFMRLDNRPADR